MASRTILHVGAMKSGTTHIQSRLFANQRALRELGVMVPGARWNDQTRAVVDLHRIQRRGPERANGDWQALADEVADHAGTAVVSMEFLGPSSAEEIADTCAAVPNPEVVITVRDLNRSLVAMWQETVQNGSPWGFRAYLESAEATRAESDLPTTDSIPRPGGTFWRQQGIVRMARHWSAAAPLTLITVPHPGASRNVLWERFCQVLDVPVGGWADAPQSNESIGVASAVVLRQVNEILDTGRISRAARRVRKRTLAKQVLAGRKADEPAIGLPVAGWVEDQAARMVADLAQVDLTLIGDWEELRPVDVPGVDPDEVSPDDVISAAVAGLAGLVRRGDRDDEQP